MWVQPELSVGLTVWMRDFTRPSHNKTLPSEGSNQNYITDLGAWQMISEFNDIENNEILIL